MNGDADARKPRGIPAQMKKLNERVDDLEKRLNGLTKDVNADIAALEARLAAHELALERLGTVTKPSP